MMKQDKIVEQIARYNGQKHNNTIVREEIIQYMLRIGMRIGEIQVVLPISSTCIRDVAKKMNIDSRSYYKENRKTEEIIKILEYCLSVREGRNWNSKIK